RTAEPGLRAALQPVLERAAELVASARWPVGGADGEAIEAVGLDASGRGVGAGARGKLGPPALRGVLDALPGVGGAARGLARGRGRPPGSGAPRPAAAALDYDRAVLDACAAIGVALALSDARARRSGDWGLEPRVRPELGAAIAQPAVPAWTTTTPVRESAPGPIPEPAAPRSFAEPPGEPLADRAPEAHP